MAKLTLEFEDLPNDRVSVKTTGTDGVTTPDTPAQWMLWRTLKALSYIIDEIGEIELPNEQSQRGSMTVDVRDKQGSEPFTFETKKPKGGYVN